MFRVWPKFVHELAMLHNFGLYTYFSVFLLQFLTFICSTSCTAKLPPKQAVTPWLHSACSFRRKANCRRADVTWGELAGSTKCCDSRRFCLLSFRLRRSGKWNELHSSQLKCNGRNRKIAPRSPKYNNHMLFGEWKRMRAERERNEMKLNSFIFQFQFNFPFNLLNSTIETWTVSCAPNGRSCVRCAHLTPKKEYGCFTSSPSPWLAATGAGYVCVCFDTLFMLFMAISEEM